MNRYLILAVAMLGADPCSTSRAADWIFMPSYYSHDPETGQRVTQYEPAQPALVQVAANYVRSGYRHTRSRIEVGGSADYLHMTEEWGRPVRPYGEWQRPFRPYSVPYDLWGPAYGPWGPAYGPWGPAVGPYSYGPYDGYGYDRDRRYDHGAGHGPGDDGDGRGGEHHGNRERHRDADRPRRGDDGYPGRFFGRPTTDHEFYWPRPRAPGRSGATGDRPPEKRPPERPSNRPRVE